VYTDGFGNAEIGERISIGSSFTCAVVIVFLYHDSAAVRRSLVEQIE
jgi:hypothetical protein